jgi:c-di-GMP-binding flagellar brake protein YcgR
MYIKRPSEHNLRNSAKPDDRRTVKRRHLFFYLRVWQSDSNRLLGHLVDITPGGMMLVSEEPIAVGEEFKLEIRTPDTEGAMKPMQFTATCRWSDNDINSSFYDSGFEFLDNTPEDIETISKLVEEYGFND